MTQKLYLYELAPMDFEWSQMPTVTEYAKFLLDSYGPLEDAVTFLGFVEKAIICADDLWPWRVFKPDCDMRVAVMPAALAPHIALVWKEDKVSATYVVSQVRLSWLDGGYVSGPGPAERITP